MELFIRYIKGMRKYVIVVIVAVVLGVFAYYYTHHILDDMIKRALIEMAKQGAKTVENDITWRLGSLESVSKLEYIKDSRNSISQNLNFLKSNVRFPYDPDFAFITRKGIMESASGKRADVSNEDFFKKAIQGERAVSVYQTRKSDGLSKIVFSVPFYLGDSIEGVICSLYSSEFLNILVEDINMSTNGYAYIIDQEGNTIAHKDRSLVESSLNNLRDSKGDPSLQKLVDLETKMVAGDTSAGEYTFNGQEKYMGFTKVSNMPWSIAVTSLKSEVFASTHPMLVFIIVFVCLFGVLMVGTQAFFVTINRRMRREEKSLKKAVETANIIIISFLEDGLILKFNRNAEEWLGFTQDQVVKILRIYDLLGLKDQQKLKKVLDASDHGILEENFELCIRTRNGGAEHVVFNLNVVDQENSTKVYEMMGIDITPRVKSEIELMEKHEELSAVYEELAASEEELKDQLNELIRQKIMLQEKDERHNLVVEASNIGIWDWDMVSDTHFYSDKWYEIFDMTKGDYTGKELDFLELVIPEDHDIPYNAYNNHLANRTSYYECEYRVKTKKGNIKWIYAVGKALWDTDGKPIKMAGAHTDISAKKEIEERVNNLAYYDTLTGLSNRSRLIEIFNELKDKVSRMALIYIDLDNFKMINDSYGHTIGDKLLIDVSLKLNGFCTSNMHISRNSGDEFALLAWDFESEASLEEFIDNLVHQMEGLVRIQDYNISLSTHTGISLYPKDAQTFNDLLKNADTAMYRACEKRMKYLFYNAEMNDAIIERLNMRNSLKEALEKNEFLLYYQPQFRSCDRRIMGFEALVRWKSPTMGMVSPLKFIPAAEESMLIIPMGLWILEEAIRFVKRVHQEGYSDLIMSVNISVIQLMQDNFAEAVIRLVEAYDLAPELLELEITESAMMESMESVLKNIIFLKSRGIRFALDDFGTGYSSLNYLTQLPINTLKIDKSFIDNIGRIKEKAFLISSIVEIGQKLGLSIVAEGVETEDQFDYLVNRRCERIQGYLLSKPLPEEDVIKLMTELESKTASA